MGGHSYRGGYNLGGPTGAMRPNDDAAKIVKIRTIHGKSVWIKTRLFFNAAAQTNVPYVPIRMKLDRHGKPRRPTNVELLWRLFKTALKYKC